jgi:pimeloyl-ACP methyl ester carboxylesterase
MPMKNCIYFILTVFIAIGNSFSLQAQTTITFLSKDSVTITADLYIINDTLPYMVLCHQADYSRGEYKETATKFTRFKYNCIALDARSGNKVNGVINQTALSAKEKNKPTSYLDAEQDIISAIDYAYKQSNKKVMIVGSSYSASLALKIGTVNDKVNAVIAFSPGEYFGDKLNLKNTIASFDKPLFVTSSKEEAQAVSVLIKDIKSQKKQQFIPQKNGVHGSKALWKKNPDFLEYWEALAMFMWL